MPVANKTTPKKAPRRNLARPTTWQDAIRIHLGKVPEVEAVFVNSDDNVLHVYSVVRKFDEAYIKRLVKQESLIEKAFPKLALEFHIRAHMGREAHEAVPFDAGLLFQR